jgi:Rrf2 family protein
MPRLINISEAVSLALHTMALLATVEQRRVRNQELADSLNASKHHLAKVMQRLVRAELVDSICGPQGGFLLRRPADKITLLEVYEAIEGHLGEARCLLKEPVCRGRDCILGEVIHSIQKQLRDYLNDTTLADLAGGSSFDLQFTYDQAGRGPATGGRRGIEQSAPDGAPGRGVPPATG